MPTYEYRCPRCGNEPTLYCTVEQRTSQRCPICKSPLIRAYRTPPATACHGCPSYEFRREGSEQANRRRANVKMNDRNQDEINYAAAHKWKLHDADEVDRHFEAQANKPILKEVTHLGPEV